MVLVNCDDDSNPVMPFGQHRGEHLDDIDTEYLDWLIGQDWLKDPLRSDVENNLRTRADWKGM